MMLQKKATDLTCRFLVLSSLSFVLCILFSGALPVHANPVPAFGWVEVRCDPVPEDFSATATVVLSNTETGEMYTITCHKVNGYIGRLQLPAGKYQVEQTTTADNFAYEALTSTISFDITADMPAAHLIKLEIIKHDAIFTVPEQTPETDPEADVSETVQPTQPSGDTSDSPSSAGTSEAPENAVLDMIEEESRLAAEQMQNTTNASVQDDNSITSVVSRVILIVFGTGIFVVLVFGTVLLLRKNHDE